MMGHRVTTIDDLGDGLFRKVRRALEVEAFGVNAMVLPPFEVEGESFELDPGGLCHVQSTTPRRFWNAGDGELVLLVVGGKDGYVGRDGHFVHPEDEERRRSFAAGDESAILRRP